MSILGHHISKMLAIYVAAGVVFVLLLVVAWRFRRRPKKLDIEYCKTRWQEAQKLCAKEETWPLAIINADKLLEEVLKKRKYKGKTMGEKLVSAQHDIGDNDLVWFAHKLRNKLVQDEIKKLKKKYVMEALIGFRESLKDLGAL
jgi:hypothetical protein